MLAVPSRATTTRSGAPDVPARIPVEAADLSRPGSSTLRVPRAEPWAGSAIRSARRRGTLGRPGRIGRWCSGRPADQDPLPVGEDRCDPAHPSIRHPAGMAGVLVVGSGRDRASRPGCPGAGLDRRKLLRVGGRSGATVGCGHPGQECHGRSQAQAPAPIPRWRQRPLELPGPQPEDIPMLIAEPPSPADPRHGRAVDESTGAGGVYAPRRSLANGRPIASIKVA